MQPGSLWINYVFGVKVQGANQIWEYSLCMVIALEPKAGIVIVSLDNISVEELLIQCCKEWEAVVLKLS